MTRFETVSAKTCSGEVAEAAGGMEHTPAEDIASQLLPIARCLELLGDEATGVSDLFADELKPLQPTPGYVRLANHF